MSAEIPHSHNKFYKPLTNIQGTWQKIQGLLDQSPATLSDRI